MKLYFDGHDERYAAEQTLLTLFPEETPLYPAGGPAGTDGELELRLVTTASSFLAKAQLRYGGKTAQRQERIDFPADSGDEGFPLELQRRRRRALQRALYHAAVELLGREPSWGLLSGVRPVKLPVRARLAGATAEEARETLLRDYRVSPAQAALTMDCAEAALALTRSLAPEEFSLYVSIPFCPSRCSYCSFISASAAGGHKLMEPYLEALLQEVETAGRRVAELGLRPRSVYIGGGTPTTLSAAQLAQLLGALRRSFSLPEGLELTVEAGRPDSITAEKLQALRDADVNRISLNPQSMSDAVLRAIGRNHTAEDIRSTLPLVRAAGFSQLNMDLIAGLPQDSPEGFAKSLTEVIAFAPSNITVHTLARKKGASLSKDTPLPSEAALSEMLSCARAALPAAGYRPYYLYRQKYSGGSFENVGWAKPGAHSLYNICMMEELHSVLALGAGGVSKAVRYEKGSLRREANPKYPQEYLQQLPQILAQKASIVL